MLQADKGVKFSNIDLNNYFINNGIKLIYGHVRHESQRICESFHKEIKKCIDNRFLELTEDFNILNALGEITNIHNDKENVLNNKMPKVISDLNDSEYINII